MKKKLATFALCATLVTSSVPAQAGITDFIGNFFRWGVDQVDLSQTIQEKDEQATKTLRGVGTLGRLFMAAAAFVAVDAILERTSGTNTGILTALLGLGGLMGFDWGPVRGKIDQGKEFWYNTGWVARDPERFRDAGERARVGAECLRAGLDQMEQAANGFGLFDNPAPQPQQGAAPQQGSAQPQTNDARPAQNPQQAAPQPAAQPAQQAANAAPAPQQAAPQQERGIWGFAKHVGNYLFGNN